MMADKINLNDIAPKAPGYILAPTVFQLDGDADDYIDWYPTPEVPSPESTVDQPFCWLLVFRSQLAEEAGKPGGKGDAGIRLAGEFMMDMLGRIRSVSLEQHSGKDVRPPSKRFLDSNLMQWGWRYLDSQVPPFRVFDYWVLCSPFQLAWASLPHLDSKAHVCASAKFKAWADERGLEKLDLAEQDVLQAIRRKKVEVPVPSVWREGFACNRLLLRAIDRKRIHPQQARERLLYQLVDLIRKNNPQIRYYLKKGKIGNLEVDQSELEIYGAKLALETQFSDEELENASNRFLKFIASKGYAALKKDAQLSKDPSVAVKLLMAMDRIFSGTSEAPKVFSKLVDHAPEMKELLKNHYDFKSDFKTHRKLAKSYWYLVKLFLQAADIKTGIPGWLVEPSKSFARNWYGTELHMAEAKAGIRSFEKADIEKLKAQSTESLGHVQFYLCLEIVNVGLLVKDLLDTAGKGEISGKKSLALVGALLSAESGTLEVVKATNKKLAARMAAEGKKFAPGVIGGMALGNMTKAMGIGSSGIDIFLGTLSVWSDKDIEDGSAMYFHGAQIAGGAISLLGYALMIGVATAPIGALCVLVGTLVGMAGSVGAQLFKTPAIENWVKFCQWGSLAGSAEHGTEHQDWAGGLAQDLHGSINRQLDTLNILLLGLRVEGALVFDQIKNPSLEVEVCANLLAEDACISLEVVIDGKVVRKLSPWKHGKDQPDSDGAYRAKFQAGEATNATLRVQVDLFGNKAFLFPPKRAMEKSVVLVRPKGTLANPFLDRPF
jgi:hypothetical protein